MRNKIFPVILIWLFLTGCIEIEENININHDLSGHVVYQLKTSPISTFLSGFLDNAIQSQIKSEADKLITKLKNQPGINNVIYEANNTTGSFKVSFDYDKTRNFNKALFAMGDARKSFITPGYLKVSKRRVKKINFSNYLSLYLKREDIVIPENYFTDTFTFRSTITVPKKIRKLKGEGANINSDETTAVQLFTIQQIIHDKVNTGIKIKY